MNDVVISGTFHWDRDKPQYKGGKIYVRKTSKFFCTPFMLDFTISKAAPKSVRYLFKNRGYKEISWEKNSSIFIKRLYSASDVLDEVNNFTTKYLEKHIIDGQAPERTLTWQFDKNFLWHMMYFKQSVKRYGIRPNAK
jgi:hypothetical protein